MVRGDGSKLGSAAVLGFACFFVTTLLVFVGRTIDGLPVAWIIPAAWAVLGYNLPRLPGRVHAVTVGFLLLGMTALFLYSRTREEKEVWGPLPIYLSLYSWRLFWVGMVFYLVTLTGWMKSKVAVGPLLYLTFFALALAVLSSSIGGSGWQLAMFQNLGLSHENAETATFYFRKSVHFTAYGLAGLAALNCAKDFGLNAQGATLWALFLVGSYATFDECRQTFVSNRTGTWTDVLLDLAGAFVFMTVLGRAFATRSSRKPVGKPA